MVSIHARTGRATLRACPRRTRDATCFNSRAHGARDKRKLGAIIKAAFQFTRARGARRPASVPLQVLLVSIHARTGRATLDAVVELRPGIVSIHARTGRATKAAPRSLHAILTFQFTRARGARLYALIDGEYAKLVSIHARTGRATVLRDGLVHVVRVSIHARTGRATTVFYDSPGQSLYVFQFTRARGARRIGRTRLPRSGRFNSRAHGARDSVASTYATKAEFQFTRARGARRTPRCRTRR